MINNHKYLAAAMLLAICFPAGGAEPSSPHPVVAGLVDDGFELDEGVVVKLTAPVINSGMDAGEQRAAIEKLVGRARLAQFLQNRLTARQEFRVDSEPAGEKGMVRRLDQYFVVHGDIELFRDEELMDDFMAKEKKADEADAEPEKFQQYLESLAEDGKKPEAGKPYLYRYRYALLDKVVISGLIQGQSYSDEKVVIESALSAAALLDDSDNPTVWRAIPRRARGDEDLAQPEPFRGLAGYMQTTDLEFLEDAVLVEVHGVLIEPRGWFDGKNLLASKLGIVAEQNVRDLRRKVKRLKDAAAQR